MIWKNEKDFEKHYFDTGDPKQQLVDLAEWRLHQIATVGRLPNIINLVSSEQYSTFDHFILELLQNADDNQYSSTVLPSMRMELFNNRIEITNNEKGFSAADVYSITYAADSTKRREATASTYIGEKGIGFKSVFAIAKWVDIHSNGYHFRLKNDQFIVPHPIRPKKSKGTHIVLSFRNDRKGIAKALSQRLQQVGSHSQQFLLFLQKLKRLEIVDNVARKRTVINTSKGSRSTDVVVAQGRKKQSYLRVVFPKTVPKRVVQDRYQELTKPLPRETVIAVPVLEKDVELPDAGKLFCFLPTRVSTGVPLHIQVDGKTTTNRENVLEFQESLWNKEIFSDLASCLIDTYIKLTEDKRFHSRLPEYWPELDGETETGNQDIDAILTDVSEKLTEKPVVLDRHGNFRSPEDVYLVPEGWESLLYEDKYEEELGDETFVDSVWSRRYREKLSAVGVEEIGSAQLLRILRAGAPTKVSKGSEQVQRRFLAKVIQDIGSYYRRSSLKYCPIFPLLSDGETHWGDLSGDALWLKTETQSAPDTIGVAVIDPRFTYVPGGSAKKTGKGRGISDANRRFREFLQDDLDIPPFSEAELLRRTVVERLQRLEEEGLKKIAVRREIGELWNQLYNRIWKRRRTLVKEIGEEALDEFFNDIGDCQITVRPEGKDAWSLGPASESFLGRPIAPDSRFEKAYKGTGVPVIQLEFKPAKKKTRSKGRKKAGKKKPDEWKGWREFLAKVGAHSGPYLSERSLSDFMSGRWGESIGSSNKYYPRLKKAIDSAVKSYYEFDESSYVVTYSSTTTSLDDWTVKALGNEHSRELVAEALRDYEEELSSSVTDVWFRWGYKHNSRCVKTPILAIHDQLAENLTLPTTLGLMPASLCFAATPINEQVLSCIAPVLDTTTVKLPDDLLELIGIRADVTISDLQQLIKSWTASDECKAGQNFDPFLEAIANFLVWRPDQTEEALRVLKVWDAEKSELVPLKSWIAGADATAGPTVARLLSLINSGSLQSPQSAVDTFFAIQDLAVQPDVVAFRLAAIGRRTSVDRDFAKEVRAAFDKQLRADGLKFFGKKLTKHAQLPFVWIGNPPLGKAPKSILVLSGAERSGPDLKQALSLLEWPSSNDGSVRVVQDKTLTALAPNTAARVVGSVSLLAGKIDATHQSVADKLRSNRFFQGNADAMEQISQSKSLKLRLAWCKKKAEIRVSYWAESEHLYLDAGSSVQNSLAAYIDDATNSTVAWAFDSIWNSYEVENFVDSGLDSPEAPMSPPKHPDQRDPSTDKEGAGPTGDAGDIFAEEPDGDDHDTTAADNKIAGDGPRPRLRSMVMTGGGSKGSGGSSGAASGEVEDKDNEVEKKGVELFTQKFEEMGANVVSREKENVGWDFDVTMGYVTLKVELKASRDRWSGWEHAVSRNEFLTALEEGDNYYLCAVDQVFSEQPEFYFINDPANAVDDFLFDHPWKSRALGLDSLEAQLKAKSGAIED